MSNSQVSVTEENHSYGELFLKEEVFYSSHRHLYHVRQQHSTATKMWVKVAIF